MMRPLLSMTVCLILCVSSFAAAVLGKGAPPEPQQASAGTDADIQRLSETARLLQRQLTELQKRVAGLEARASNEDGLKAFASHIFLTGVCDTPAVWYVDRLADQRGRLEVGDSLGFEPYSFLIMDIRGRSVILKKVDGTVWEWKLGDNLANLQRILDDKDILPGSHPPQPAKRPPHVRIEYIEGLDITVITGSEEDAERVLEIIKDIEKASQR